MAVPSFFRCSIRCEVVKALILTSTPRHFDVQQCSKAGRHAVSTDWLKSRAENRTLTLQSYTCKRGMRL